MSFDAKHDGRCRQSSGSHMPQIRFATKYENSDARQDALPEYASEKTIQIADWERTKADLLYYQGNIISVWMYLSEIFSRCDGVLYAALPKPTTHLHHLLLRYIEVSFLIRKMTTPVIKSGMPIDLLLTTLDRIIEDRRSHPEHRSRALALRVSEQAIWFIDNVEDVQGGPASQTLKQNSIRQIKEAITIHEEYATSNGASLNFVYAMVRRGLGYQRAPEEWDDACGRLALLDRDDIYFSLKAITQKLFRALSYKDISTLRASIPALQETLTLGEWGKLFYDKWWKEEEQKLIGSDLWEQACSCLAYTSQGYSHSRIQRTIPMAAENPVPSNAEKPKGDSNNELTKVVVGSFVRAAVLGY